MHGVKLTETNTRNEMIFAAKHARYHECQDSERNNTATYSHYMLTFIPTFEQNDLFLNNFTNNVVSKLL